MKVNVFNLSGKSIEKIELPKLFKEGFRPDLIERAFLAIQSHKRQPYGSDPRAGFKTSAHYHGRRRIRHAMMGRDMARLPRLHSTSPHLIFRAMRAPSVVKGRRAHPPKAERDWNQKINEKERKLAIKSAMAATANEELVKARGHKIEKIKSLPLIVEDKIESVKKTRDVEEILKNLGLGKEMNRSRVKKVRPGKGTMRGRKYKRKVGPLIVVTDDKGIAKACRNVAGVDVKRVDELSVEDLAPGAKGGRLTIWSKTTMEELRGV